MKSEDKGLEADLVSYNSLAPAWAKVGKPVAAERWLVKLEDKCLEADVVSFNPVIGA